MSKTCIPVFADVEQINQCKKEIIKVEGTISAIANILSLSGNKVRLKILYLLHKETKMMCPCDLSDILDMTVPAISQHLKKLKGGGLVFTEKIGQTIFYSLVEENIRSIKPLLENVSAKDIKRDEYETR